MANSWHVSFELNDVAIAFAHASDHWTLTRSVSLHCFGDPETGDPETGWHPRFMLDPTWD